MADRDLPVQADGEIIGRRSLRVEVVPHALRVVVPEVEVTAPSDGTSPGGEGLRRVGRAQRALGSLLGPIGTVDTSTLAWISSLPELPAVRLAMKALSTFASKGILWAVGLLLASWLDPRRGRQAARDVLPSMWLAGLTVEMPLKRLFSRARPVTALAVTGVVGSKPSGYSFPSAHTAVSFAAAWLLAPHYPRLAPVLYGLASLVGLSRLYLRAHYLSDVVTGAICGLVFAAAYHRMIRWLYRRRVGVTAHSPAPPSQANKP